MNKEDRIVSIFANTIVVAIGFAFLYCSLVVSIPSIRNENNSFFVDILWYITALIFLMWFWCWIYSATADPGRISDDLQIKGYLQEVQQGDIPIPLRDLPICHKCNLPQPPKSEHCDVCNACHLRSDHHCAVIGNCVADKNLKSFVLSFVYGGIFTALTFIEGIISFIISSNEIKQPTSVLLLFASIYSVAICIVLFAFGLGIFFNNLSDSKLSFRKFLWTFGDRWWQRLVPIQKKTTFLAWPGVCWVNDYEA